MTLKGTTDEAIAELKELLESNPPNINELLCSITTPPIYELPSCLIEEILKIIERLPAKNDKSLKAYSS